MNPGHSRSGSGMRAEGDDPRIAAFWKRYVPVLAVVRPTFESDCAEGYGEVWMEESLAHKYPNAPREWAWQ